MGCGRSILCLQHISRWNRLFLWFTFNTHECQLWGKLNIAIFLKIQCIL